MTGTSSTADLPLPHDDFEAGFRVGWEAVRGETQPTRRLFPASPRLVVLGQSRFTMVVRAGIEVAMGVHDLDEVLAPRNGSAVRC